MTDLEPVLHAATAYAREAGALLLERAGSLQQAEVRSKSAARDLVTSADLAAEELLLQRLSAAFPEDGFHAEESGVTAADAECMWYVDPLDGTTNFVHQLPMYGVSLARVRRGRPDVAVVFLPRLDECFCAVAGGGCSLNGERVQVSTTAELEHSLLATGFPYRRHLLADNNLDNFNRLFLRQRGVRRMGSAAADLAYVACGRLDAFWELHLGPYDVAAGGLLVREAGGVTDTLNPGGDWIHGRNVVAGPAPLVEQLRAVLLAGRGADYPPLGDREGAAPDEGQAVGDRDGAAE